MNAYRPFGARGGVVRLDGTEMDYIVFGRGQRTLVMIPGVGDGLKTVRGMALPFSLLYRQAVPGWRAFVFSRRRLTPVGYDSRAMAGDVSRAMERLGIGRAAVLGVSLGGMIAQWLAIDHPEQVERLVLAVTAPCSNERVEDAVETWLRMAEEDDYKGIMLDTAERSYSPAYLRRARGSYALMSDLTKPRSYSRFRAQAAACLSHDARSRLGEIRCPTLVIGGEEDRIVTPEASRELARAIPGSELFMYPGLGHGAYEEAKDFLDRVLAFCGR